jgi:thiol-disulfide isomerase/thioredoxin
MNFNKIRMNLRSFVISILVFCIYSLTFAQERNVETLQINQKAPDFNLRGVDDKIYSLKDFKDDKILVVLFTCNHCPTAQAYEDKFINYVNHYRGKGVGFVGISPNSPKALSLSEFGYSDMGDDLEDMKIRATDKNYNFPYLYDGETQEASIKYGPVATPHVFVFDSERKLRYAGRIDDTENPYIEPSEKNLEDALNALLAGNQVRVTNTKTFGCSIKWAWKDSWKKKLLEDWAKAPVNLEEIDQDGIRNEIQNNSDKLKLINIWATWCGPCVIEFPDFVTIDRMYRGRDFEFVSISADKLQNKEKAFKFLQKKEASNRNLIFNGDNSYDLIEAVDKDWQGALPYTMLVAPGGEIIYKIDGPIDPITVKKKIVEYLGRYYADDK